MMRQPVGVGLELGVAQRAVLEHHRHRVRRAHRLRGKQRRQRRAAVRPSRRPPHRRHRPSPSTGARAPPVRGVVPAPQDGVALGLTQDRQACRAPAPASATAPPAAGSAARPAPQHVAASNRSLAYSSTPSMPGRRAVGGAPLDQPDRQVELRARGRDRLRRDRKPRQLEPAVAALRLERQHHLEQRVPRQRPRRVEHLDQPLERQLRHGHRPQGCRPAPGRPAR